ncbi:hypothetical protein EOA50_27180 [Mesorhizobium sp. M1A.F.Ca.IN.020.30.1.1]|uniref:hypothetical protein n=1 Tax=unclassified Mesorhizobium TaxID=325217 RepID=UPI000FCC4C9D|nr:MULTISPECIES: hypothetical protein [unclassified Mesorhizobium]MCT2580601.1 hypothetical protein [Mesorhizobium sp. P13.3]MDF3169543.1 hypothetical protein [Mesorhizobium sp. P16.1]MDF3178795.1 hypothetical protein [Mesorhizobium sp. P17.1]MDF3186458.1 hypothetical protein [Mesorhizobium sp. ICCV3110.1]RUV24508.1 hypothetical protein EOA91_11640 [Mesorhizobium sp. M1A.F.Ca.IN.022.04.1.1]
MIRVAHLSTDRRFVISVSIQDVDWVADPLSVASDTANIGDAFDGVTFTPPAPPPPAALTSAQWSGLAQSKLEATYDGRRASLASYYTFLERIERQGSLTDDQKADLAVLDAAQVWEQAVLDAAAKAATKATDPSSFVWPATPKGLTELIALS